MRSRLGLLEMNYRRMLILFVFCLLHSSCQSFLLPQRNLDERVRVADRRGFRINASLREETDTSKPTHVDGLVSRRQSIQGCILTALTVSQSSPLECLASEESVQTPLLERRLIENLLTPPSYGMETPDVYYPSWFDGKWQVESTTTDVQAPCGVALFGGNQTYTNARQEIGSTMTYESRFLRAAKDGASTVIADREYNVRSIARAAMGPNSVLDIPTSTPNKFTAILSPQGSPSVLQVDLLILNRRQEPQTSPLEFQCSEVCRQIVAPVGRSSAPASLLKEIETISLYTYNTEKDTVLCRQRSATFLLPSQENPTALRMWQASQGRPVDVRFYDVTYTKR